MPSYLVECYVPNFRSRELPETVARVRAAARSLTAEGAQVRYLCSTFLSRDAGGGTPVTASTTRSGSIPPARARTANAEPYSASSHRFLKRSEISSADTGVKLA